MGAERLEKRRRQQQRRRRRARSLDGLPWTWRLASLSISFKNKALNVTISKHIANIGYKNVFLFLGTPNQNSLKTN
jgi:hypothetical protein